MSDAFVRRMECVAYSLTFITGDIVNTVSTPAKLARRGNEWRPTLPPDHSATNHRSVDSTLVPLVAQGFAAHEHLLAGRYVSHVAFYDRRHLQQLARVSWLAPDVIAAIFDRRHPIQLTGPHLLRCADVPGDWRHQRSFVGFS